MIVEPTRRFRRDVRGIDGYCLGITMDGETAVLRRFLPRGEIYRYFP